jgi:hypothetical protein
MLPSVTMSSPLLLIADDGGHGVGVRLFVLHFLERDPTSRPSSWCLNHCGLGYDPTMVVGRSLSTTFFVAM